MSKIWQHSFNEFNTLEDIVSFLDQEEVING